jgi:putative mycofactocin binding protein MftB
MPGEPGGPRGTAAFRADLAYEKHPRVAIRHEEFGGLAYHYGNRRLVFLKSPALVDVVEALAAYPTAGEAVAACAPAGQARACTAALGGLLAAGVIRARSSRSTVTAEGNPATVKQN